MSSKKFVLFLNLCYNNIMRIDKFLKVSRIIKRRSVAAKASDEEMVKINGKTAKPATKVKIGDTVCVEFGNRTVTFVVKNLDEKANKDAASSLYEII